MPVTSPLLRLFAVFWCLLAAGSVGVAICGPLIALEAYHSTREYTAYRADLEDLKLPMGTLEPAQRLQPVLQTPPAPDPNQDYFATPEEAQAASTKPPPEPQQQGQNVTEIRSAVDSWEASIRTRDPDYGLLSGAVRRYVQALILERGTPRTAEQAVALVQAAYDEVKREWGSAKPVAAPAVPAPFVFKPDPVPPDPTNYVAEAAVVLLVSLLPFSIVTVIRWIIIGRWRLGPHW